MRTLAGISCVFWSLPAAFAWLAFGTMPISVEWAWLRAPLILLSLPLGLGAILFGLSGVLMVMRRRVWAILMMLSGVVVFGWATLVYPNWLDRDVSDPEFNWGRAAYWLGFVVLPVVALSLDKATWRRSGPRHGKLDQG